VPNNQDSAAGICPGCMGGQYFTETGFFNQNYGNTNGLATAGLADAGTRLMLRFAGVPAGAKVLVGVYEAGATASTSRLRLVTTDTNGGGAFNATSATSSPVGGPALAPVTLNGGAGIAVYEVIQSNPIAIENIDVPIAVAYAANSPSLGTATVSGSFAPLSAVITQNASAPLPRFADVPIAKVGFSINGCAGSCSYTLSPASRNVGAQNGSFAITVTTAAGCPWSSANATAVPWLSVPSLSGTGPGLVPVSIAANPFAVPRQAIVSIAGFSTSVSQLGKYIANDLGGVGFAGVVLYDPIGIEYTASGLGNGTFLYQPAPYTPGFDTLRLGDWDGDGKSDIVVYNSANAVGYIGKNYGGGFTFASLFWGPGYNRVLSGDLNGDGRADFILHRTSDGTTYTAISNWDGTFNYQYSLVSVGFSDMIAADFNGDGMSDVLFYRTSDGKAFVGTSNGTGGFAFSPLTIEPGYTYIDTGDVNGDGKADVMFYASGSGTAKVGLSTGNSFSFTTNYWSHGFTATKFLDFDGDGKADLALYNRNNAIGYLGVGDGTGNFTFGSLFWGLGMDNVQTVDLNGDGKMDVILYNSTNGSSYTGISSGSVIAPFTYQYAYWGNNKILAK
jgi:hypothetical protein